MSGTNQGWCLLVHLFPRVIYHRGDVFLTHPVRQRRAAGVDIALTAASILGTAGAGVATAAKATQHSTFSALRVAIAEDLQQIESSISSLEKSLSSLAEGVLQNRRGLDLGFLQQGGLCTALGEECCFYADHTGVARGSMKRLREKLAQRKLATVGATKLV